MLTKITGTGSGTAPVVNLSFPFIDKAHVLASVNGSPVTINWTGAAQVTFAATVANGATWLIYRQTPTNPLVDFTNGAVLTETDLDLANRQHQYREEELAETTAVAALPDGSYGDVAVGGGGTVMSINVVTGDSGSGGIKGLVPAPGAGDAAAGKYLKANGTWAVPPVGAGGGLSDGAYGDITVSGTGTAMTIGNAKVSLAKMANLAANSILGNNTGSPATPIALTGAQTTAMLSNVVGDGGSGGTKGLVPAPGSGDTAAGKFLKADGTWAVPAGGGAGTTTNALTINSSGGAAPGTTFNGSIARTIDYSTLGAAPARPTIATPNVSFSAADADNNSHKVASGASKTLTLGNITAGTSFTVRFTTAWSLSCAGGLSKNGADPTGITTGSVAANSLITFLHEGSGVWVATGGGLS